ncbi:ArsR/SmtB family transcription factor [Acidiphilium sp.]|uniref:ArsR/SmtB family transcription factor n=1 Tax=Acidiphilium sp. TaxID=527 RepID=UPI003D005297
MKVFADAMMSRSAAAGHLMKALANPHRLLILCQLSQGERCVGDLVATLGLRASTMSQHLARLRRDNLVAARRDRQTMHYRIDDPAAQRIVETLFSIYCATTSDNNDIGNNNVNETTCPLPQNNPERNPS